MRYILFLACLLSSEIVLAGSGAAIIAGEEGSLSGTRVAATNDITAALTTSTAGFMKLRIPSGGMWLVGYKFPVRGQSNPICHLWLSKRAGLSSTKLHGTLSHFLSEGQNDEHHNFQSTTPLYFEGPVTLYANFQENGGACTLFGQNQNVIGAITEPDVDSYMWAVKLN